MSSQVPPESGKWAYVAGASGSPSIPAGGNVLGITAHAPAAGAGSIVINGGPSIIVPAGCSIDIAPRGNLTAATMTFTGTDSYFVEWVW